MKKMHFILLFIACISFSICGCSQSEINEERILSESHDAHIESECAPTPNHPSEVMPTPILPDAATPNTGEMELTVDYFGDGKVIYSFSDVRLTENLPEGENLAGDYAGPFLLIDVQVTNIDVPNTSTFVTNANINCFNLYKTDSESTNMWYREPDWFSDAHVDSSDPDMKSYFTYTLPIIGETESFTLGYSMDTEAISFLESGDLSLTYAISGEIVPLNYTS